MSHLDRYTCEDLFRRLDDYLDRELSPEEKRLVQEHLEACAVCTMEYDFESKLLQDLKQKVRRIDVPKNLAAKIHRLLDSDA